MSKLLIQLVRCNFRCGRMLHSRTRELAGWGGVSAAHLKGI